MGGEEIVYLPGLVGDQAPPLRVTTEDPDLSRESVCGQETVTMSIPNSDPPHTVLPSFQMQKFHPPTVSTMSLKKGDLSAQHKLPQ